MKRLLIALVLVPRSFAAETKPPSNTDVIDLIRTLDYVQTWQHNKQTKGWWSDNVQI